MRPGTDVVRAAAFASRRARIRSRAAVLSRALIAYGIVGLLGALLGLAALVWTIGTVNDFNDRIGDESAELAETVRGTAEALGDASRTAESFGTTLEQTPPSVRQAAQTIRNLRPRLEALEAQAGAINILGARPLAGLGELFGQMAVDLVGLDDQLDQIADGLGGNQASLEANARSLGALAERLDEFADRLDDGLVSDSLGELRSVLVLVIAMLALALAVPASGALAFGLWLRREFGLGRRPEVSVIVVER